MKIEKNHLIKILSIARMAVAGSDHLEQLGHFIFEGEHLVTFNNRLLVYYPFKTDFECSVRSELFFKQLSKFATETLTLKLVENKLMIRGKRESASMTVLQEKDTEIFGAIDTIREEQQSCEYTKIPESFVEAIYFASQTASRDAADGTFCCVLIRDDKIWACDNYRATVYNLGAKLSDEEILIDARIANEVTQFEVVNIGISPNWIHFKNEKNVILSARRIRGDFMDLSDAFSFKGEKLDLPKNTDEILDFVSVVAAQDHQADQKVNIKIKNGLISASIEKKHQSAHKSIPLDKEYENIEISFAVILTFFKAILTRSTTLIYNLNEQKGMFRTNKFKHVLRLSPPEELEEEKKSEPSPPPQTAADVAPMPDTDDDDIPF